jgi:hypothetical protein
VIVTPKQYLILRNTVRILRGAGVALTPAQELDVQRFERSIQEYEKAQVREGPCNTEK